MSQLSLELEDKSTLKLLQQGDGQEIIILHGWTGAAEDWATIIDGLDSRASIFSYNARPYFTRNASIELMAQDIQKVIDRFCRTKPILLGHSMGALVVWEYLKQFGQEPISGTIIVDMTPCMINRPDWQLSLYRNYSEADNAQFVAELKEDFVDTVANLILSGKVLNAEERQQMMNQNTMLLRQNRLEKLDPTAWTDCWETFVHNDYRAILSQITVPTLLLYGGKSNFYGADVANFVNQSIKGSKLVMFESTGHSPQMEQPAKFTQEVAAFLDAHFKQA